MANEEMIQKHLDNFLAKIAGETPVDDTIQNSTEFWINKIAEQGGGGTEVIANPTLEGGEDDLTSIEIDGTKYAVPTVGKKYMHNIVNQNLHSGMAISFTVCTDSATPFARMNEVANYIIQNFSANSKIVASGGGYLSDPVAWYWITNIVRTGSGTIDAQGVQFYNNRVSFTNILVNIGIYDESITDTVFEI